jgi:hypothetical protein
MRKKITPPRQIAAAVILAAAVLSLSGCNLSTKANTTSGSGNNPTAAHVGLSASSLDFGSVTVGTTKTMKITLTNSTASGGPSVTISQTTATGTGFSATNTVPIELTPGQSTDLSVAFKPTASGSVSGTLSIDVIGATDPATVPLQGSGSSTSTPSAQLSVSPATLAFGSVNIGSSKNLTGTLTAANANVTVSSAAWNGTGYSVSGITFPATVQAGQSKTFTVTFAPQAAGSTPGSISFVSNAANSPSGESMTGTGVQVGQQHTVSLTWTPSTSTVAGYNVYRGTQSGGPYTKVNTTLRTSTNYADSAVQSGSTYFYVATAVDSNSSESAFSGEAVAVVPTP